MEKIENKENKFQKVIHRVKPPYYNLLGIDILDVKLKYSKLKMNYDYKLTNPYGYINGGFFSVLADAAMACALLGTMEENIKRKLVTIEYKVNLIKSVKEGSIIAEAKIIYLGKDIAVGEADLMDDDGRMVGKAIITYAIKG